MLVTITSDASYDQHSNKAGYGFLISSDAGKFSKSGPLVNANNITEAELMSIANSLYFLYHHEDLWGVSKVIMNIDFINAENFIKGGTKMWKKKKKYRQICGVITKYIGLFRKKTKSFTIVYAHVKAHTNNKDQRSKANDFVDKLAVKARKNG